MVLGRCTVLVIFWVVWNERNGRIFETARDEVLDFWWDRVHFWASMSSEFRDYSFHVSSYDGMLYRFSLFLFSFA